ncbi:hypothetical protein VNO77_07659 [Canavalia gladiata]|uniref:Uncharacterized protein n=1 Tax=Canavalia gladiata TaxID=3824 RepID=A0AAN9QW91_CANGL
MVGHVVANVVEREIQYIMDGGGDEVFLTKLMGMWSYERHAFVLCFDSEIQMTLLDIALILGLSVAANPVTLKEEGVFDLDERYRAMKGKRKMALSFLENRLNSIGDVVSDDFVRGFMLYIVRMFLSSID